MASKTDVANRVAAKLGEPRISNIDTDPSPLAQAISGMWDIVRDAYTQAYPWNFTIQRTNIAASATAPSWGWDNQFLLPTDCLRIIEVDNVSSYAVEGQYLVVNAEGPLYIKYIARIEDVGLWPPLFIEGFATEMAIEANDRITDDSSKKQVLLAMRKDVEERARSTDAMEDYPEKFEDDDWLTARI